MKVLQIIPTLGSGGAERFVVDLSNELLEQGNEVVLCTLFDIDSKEEYSFFKEELSKEIPIISLNKKLGIDFKIIKKIYNVIIEVNPEVIHSHLNTINYLVLAILILKKKKRFVHTLHSEASKLVKNKVEYYISKLMFSRRWMTPVCISNESLKSFKDYYNLDADYGKLIFNGRKEYIKKNKEKKLIKNKEEFNNIFIHVGRYDLAKNQINLVKAFTNIIKKYPDELLIIIGDGDSNIGSELKKYENRNIRLLGRRKNVIEFMENSDVFILPSIFEGMPISLIEAMSVGLFPIVTGVGGMKNLINNKDKGLIIANKNISSIEKSIIQYLGLDEDKKEVVRKNIKNDFVELYSIKKCANNYVKIFNDY